MPQAPDDLRRAWTHETALAAIQVNFHYDNGNLEPKKLGYVATEKENSAMDYLWLEWDYCDSPLYCKWKRGVIK